MARFFIDRPIFAWVVSLGILLSGFIALRALPIAMPCDREVGRDDLRELTRDRCAWSSRFSMGPVAPTPASYSTSMYSSPAPSRSSVCRITFCAFQLAA